MNNVLFLAIGSGLVTLATRPHNVANNTAGIGYRNITIRATTALTLSSTSSRNYKYKRQRGRDSITILLQLFMNSNRRHAVDIDYPD